MNITKILQSSVHFPLLAVRDKIAFEYLKLLVISMFMCFSDMLSYTKIILCLFFLRFLFCYEFSPFKLKKIDESNFCCLSKLINCYSLTAIRHNYYYWKEKVFLKTIFIPFLTKKKMKHYFSHITCDPYL